MLLRGFFGSFCRQRRVGACCLFASSSRSAASPLLSGRSPAPRSPRARSLLRMPRTLAAAAAMRGSLGLAMCARKIAATSSSPLVASTLSACVARPATHAASGGGGRFLFRRFASASSASASSAAPSHAARKASVSADAAAVAAAANSARARADEAHAHAMDILRSSTRAQTSAAAAAAAGGAAAANEPPHGADAAQAAAESPHAAFASLMSTASLEQQQAQRAAAGSQANSAAASSLHSTASAVAATTTTTAGGDETAAQLTPAAGSDPSSTTDPFADSAADAGSAPPAYFADVHPHAHAVDPALLSQLGMEEEELAALWRDYVHAQTQGSAANAATTASSVRTGLAAFPSPPSLDDPASMEHVSRQTFAMQCALESSAVSHHAREYQAQAASVIKLGKGSQLGPASAMLLNWYTPFVEQLNEQLMTYARDIDAPAKSGKFEHHHLSRGGGGSAAAGGGAAGPKVRGEDERTLGLHLLQLSAPELACITMHELFGLCLNEPLGVKFITACLAVGKAVNLEVKLAAIRSNKSEWKAMVQALNPMGNHAAGAAAQINAPAASSSSGSSAAPPAAVSSVAAPAPSGAFHFSPTASGLAEVRRRARRVHSETWNDALLARVGSMLLNVFMKVAAVPQQIVDEAEAAEAQARLENGGSAADGGAASATAASAVGMDPDARVESSLPFGSTFVPPLEKGPRALKGGGASAATPHTFYPAFQHYYITSTRSEQPAWSPEMGRPGAAGASFPSPAAPAPSDSSLGLVRGVGDGFGGGGAFSHKGGSKVQGMLRVDPRVLTAVLSDRKALDTLMPKLNPMLIPPRNWRSFDDGGYLTVRNSIVRSHGSHLQSDAVRGANLSRVLDGVNYLGSTAWTIYPEVWRVIQALWAQGGGVADLPPRKDKPLPPTPAPGDIAARRLFESVRLYNGSLHSQRCDLEYKFRACEQYEGRRIFYPYFLDFRGRAYPIPPYLNHTGGDLSRGLLKFHSGVALGERGLFWLLVQCANLWGQGVDKLAFAQRQAWTESQIAQLRRSVEDPLGDRWWLQAEKPFQFLGAAIELIKALRSPNPAQFVSTLPVHTDGSCNGLQHYAALGRDAWGGSCVNLTASERPQDVYSRVLDVVKQRLAADAANLSHARAGTAAKLLKAGLTRKIVKQSVMTSVYGVTMIGAKDQIFARLQERADIVEAFRPTGAMGEDDLRSAALYLAQLTLSSLFDAFAGARRIQEWLGDCAVRMASVQQPVSWVTPLGLPVIQPYRHANQYRIQTAMQTVVIADHNDLLPVSSVRQKSAFPPNFIHSLDASHMLMTASECKRQGLTFASVHDSFWTHAGSMDPLSAALRHQFVSLYEQPILEQVRESWVQRFPEINLQHLPARGTLDVAEVLRSPYFFS